MTAIKNENLKEEAKLENTENLVVKKKAGRPKKVVIDGETAKKIPATTKAKTTKPKKTAKQPDVAVTKTAVVDKASSPIKEAVVEPKFSDNEQFSDSGQFSDNVHFSDDEEIPIKINIKSKIKANVDELIATAETLGVEKAPENNIAASPVEKVVSNDNETEIKTEAKKEVESTVASAVISVNEKPVNADENKEDGLWNVESDAVKRVIAAANADKAISENAQEKIEEDKTVHGDSVFKISSHAIGIYKKIAYFFAFLLLAVGAAVFYFTFIRVKIVLIPSQERVSNNTIFDVFDLEKNQNIDETTGGSIAGVVKETDVKYSKKYPATDEEVLGKEVVGKVRLINNYIKNQPLVASTRLLSTDGKLFRLKNTVDIPVNGEVEAEIYADDPSPEMAIGATKFTIPGLWAGLQDKIYGESIGGTEYRQKIKKTISDDDIKNGIKDLKQELLNNAKREINDSYNNYDKIIYKIDENSVNTTVNNKVGDEVSEFEINMEAKVVVVAFNNKKFAEIAKDKLIKSLTENKELVSFDSENINYSLNNFEISNGAANVSASFEGMVTLKDNSNVIDKEKLIGLNKDQINAYLNDIDKTGNLDLAGHEIQFYPSFITKIPTLIEPGRIEIEIRK